MKQTSYEIDLKEVVGDDHAVGNDEGREVFVALSKIIDQQPKTNVFVISLKGMVFTDASFPRESVIALAKSLRGEKGFCLAGIKSRDLLDNWTYGAVAKEQPIIVFSDGGYEVIGVKLSGTVKDLLDFIMSKGKVTTSVVAEFLDVSAQNASGKLKKLYNQGLILGSKEVAESGGLEFIYRAISK
jgi:hypothetical protein